MAERVSRAKVGVSVRKAVKSCLHGLFVFGQRFGWDILPRHFYSSIPDVRKLRQSKTWRLPSKMIGVAGADINSQMLFLQECCPPPLLDRIRQGGIYEQACKENGAVGYGPIEAEFLYCFIASKRPAKIVQIGCGVSTSILLRAAAEAGYSPRIVCVDPFPSPYLTRTAKKGLIELLPIAAQEVDLEVLTALEADDLLFVDSTLTVRAGSEVNRIILEVLPRLRSGCFVHFHDVYFPYDYQHNVLDTLFFWEESSLLHAFLIDNRRCAIAFRLACCTTPARSSCNRCFPATSPRRCTMGCWWRATRRSIFLVRRFSLCCDRTTDRFDGWRPSGMQLSILEAARGVLFAVR